MLAWGVGLHTSIATASLRALVNAVNRALAQRRALEETALAFD
jgi:LeuA allosteric (dimerisation) domain.